MDIPPELRDAAAKEGPAAIGGLIGSMLIASDWLARLSYFFGGYLLARYAGPLVNSATGFGLEVGMILAGAFGLLGIERCIVFMRGIDSAELSKAATARIKRIITGVRRGDDA